MRPLAQGLERLLPHCTTNSVARAAVAARNTDARQAAHVLCPAMLSAMATRAEPQIHFSCQHLQYFAALCVQTLSCVGARWKFPYEEHLQSTFGETLAQPALPVSCHCGIFRSPTKHSFLSGDRTSTWCSHLRLIASGLGVKAAWSRSLSALLLLTPVAFHPLACACCSRSEPTP